jgi:aspartate oxidase
MRNRAGKISHTLRGNGGLVINPHAERLLDRRENLNMAKRIPLRHRFT